ncbi:MAG: prepilin-type N-terminal cleavage/methylation domain-containing protein [Patescibacteria group bacterium]
MIKTNFKEASPKQANALSRSKRSMSKGFTLIEILIVIVIIAILALVVFVAINPVGRIADANNSTRQTDVQQVAHAILMYTNDHQGQYPGGLTQLTSPLINTSAAYGYSLTGSSIGVPNCVTGSGTIPNATVTVSSSCVLLTQGSAVGNELSQYLSSFPSGSIYMAENSTGTRFVVFATGMQQGVTVDPKGYPVVWSYN